VYVTVLPGAASRVMSPATPTSRCHRQSREQKSMCVPAAVRKAIRQRQTRPPAPLVDDQRRAGNLIVGQPVLGAVMAAGRSRLAHRYTRTPRSKLMPVRLGDECSLAPSA